MNSSTPTRAEQVVLVVFVCSAIAAFGSAYGQPAAWFFWLPTVVSVFWRLEGPMQGVHRAARYTAWVLLGVAAVLGVIFMAYPVAIPEQTARWLVLGTGYGLALFSAMFALGTPRWPPATALIPAATGLVAVACFNPAAQIRPLITTPGAAMFVYLLLTRRDSGRPWKVVSVRLVISALATAVLAWTIFTFLPKLQVQVEAATLRFFNTDSGQTTPFGSQSRLGDLEELKLSKNVVLRVWTTRPQKLRGRVFAGFDGQTWHVRLTPGKPLALVAPDPGGRWLAETPGNVFSFSSAVPDIPASAVSTRIVQSVAAPGVLVAPANKLLVRVPLPALTADAFGGLTPPLSAEVRVYGVLNQPRAADEEPLAPEWEKEFLALPADLDPRWRALAEKLAADTPAVEERIAKTVDYVQNAATYSLQVGKFHTRQPVTEFFFEKKRGYCQYFASAAAILLRLQGIPARYVTGYNVQEYNRPGRHFVVRNADAHAWLEVFEPGRGWVEADPTPDAELQARQEANASGWLGAFTEWLSAETQEIWMLLRQGDWRGAAAALWQGIVTVARAVFSRGGLIALLVLLAVAAAILGRRWLWKVSWSRGRPRPPTGQSAGVRWQPLLEVLKRCWEEVGFPRPASRGLLEHLESIPQEKVSAEFRDLSRRFVDAYYRVSFGGAQISAAESSEFDSLGAELLAEAGKMRGHRA